MKRLTDDEMCGKWMPLAKEPCVRGRGHLDACRSAASFEYGRKIKAEYVRRRYTDDPEYRERGLESTRNWHANPLNRPSIFAYDQRRALRRIERRINEA